MNTFQRLQKASQTADEIVQSFVSEIGVVPDVVAERTKELSKMNKEDLIALVVELEKPKVDKGVTVAQVAQALLTNEELAIFGYEVLANKVKEVLPDAKTSSKSIASYACKQKEAWGVVPRVNFKLDPADLPLS